MKKFISLIVIALIYIPIMGQAINFDSLIEKNVIKTDKTLLYSVFGHQGHVVSYPCIAKWKNGYIISYSAMDKKSYFFFTDKDFNKTSKEVEMKKRIIYAVSTYNDEIVFLTGKKHREAKFSEFSFCIKNKL